MKAGSDSQTGEKGAGPGKEVTSRSGRTGANGKKRRKRSFLWAAIFAVFLTGMLVGWTGWEWGWLEGALKGVGRAVAGIWKEDSAEGPNRSFLEDPLTARRIEGGRVNSAVAVLSDQDEVLFLAYLRWSETGSLRMMIFPTDLKGVSSRGEDLSLASSLKAGEGNPIKLRYLMEGLAGETLHYLFLLPVRELPDLGEALGLPPVSVKEGCKVMNPFTDAWESLRKGTILRDSDRIISYVMAWGAQDPYEESIGRIGSYLKDVLERLRQMGLKGISEALVAAKGAWRLAPSPADQEEAASLAASLLFAWSEEREASCVGVPSIEILNGCGVVGAGISFGRRLEARGFRVAEATRNAKVPGEDVNDFSYKSSVIYLGEDDDLAESYGRYIAQIFRISRVEHRQGTSGLVIVVGSDLAEPVVE